MHATGLVFARAGVDLPERAGVPSVAHESEYVPDFAAFQSTMRWKHRLDYCLSKLCNATYAFHESHDVPKIICERRKRLADRKSLLALAPLDRLTLCVRRPWYVWNCLMGIQMAGIPSCPWVTEGLLSLQNLKRGIWSARWEHEARLGA